MGQGGMESRIIYKICRDAEWEKARRDGVFRGAPVDLADGFIHFSTADQLRETAARHFAGEAGLFLLSVESARLGNALKWEVSRGGDLFPHLYGVLPLEQIISVEPLPLDAAGQHRFPPGLSDGA